VKITADILIQIIKDISGNKKKKKKNKKRT